MGWSSWEELSKRAGEWVGAAWNIRWVVAGVRQRTWAKSMLETSAACLLVFLLLLYSTNIDTHIDNLLYSLSNSTANTRLYS